jgi:hypothetical protein
MISLIDSTLPLYSSGYSANLDKQGISSYYIIITLSLLDDVIQSQELAQTLMLQGVGHKLDRLVE